MASEKDIVFAQAGGVSLKPAETRERARTPGADGAQDRTMRCHAACGRTAIRPCVRARTSGDARQVATAS